MKLCNIHIKNLIILSVSGIFEGFKIWQKVAEICYQLVHDWASRGLALFLIWRHRLIYMTLTLCDHACKTVFDVIRGICPCPSPAWSWDKAYQISGCTVAQKKVKLLLEQLQVCIFAKIVFVVKCTLMKIIFGLAYQRSQRARLQSGCRQWLDYNAWYPVTFTITCNCELSVIFITTYKWLNHYVFRVTGSSISIAAMICKKVTNTTNLKWHLLFSMYSCGHKMPSTMAV